MILATLLGSLSDKEIIVNKSYSIEINIFCKPHLVVAFYHFSESKENWCTSGKFYQSS